MKLRKFFDEHYSPLKLRGAHSARTVSMYHGVLRRFREFLLRDPEVKDLTNTTVSEFLKFRSMTVGPHSVERERNQVVAMWRLACLMGLIKELPMISATPLPQKIPKAWTVDELNLLLASAESASGKIGSVLASRFWPALVNTLFETAERIGAVMACRPGDLSGQHLSVKAEYRKGGRISRVYTLSPATADMVFGVCGRERIFEWPLSSTHLWGHFKRITKRAGLYAPRLGFHTLRRSAASHYVAAGGNPSVLLGHQDARVTRKYLDPRITERGLPKPYEVLPKIG